MTTTAPKTKRQRSTPPLLSWVWQDVRARLAIGFLLLLILTAVFAPLIAPISPAVQDFTQMFAPPSWQHPLGTDDLGRDVWSRLIYGGQASLSAATIAVAVAVLVGLPIGLIAGYAGGWVDIALMRIVDALLAFPAIVLAVGITAALGPGLVNAMVAVGVVYSPSIARLVRAQVLSVKGRLFVEAAKTYGSGSVRTLVRHVLPNSLQQVVVQATTLLGLGLIAEASLSFLGLGVKYPDPSWGTMLQRAAQFITMAPYQVLAPGLAITLAVLSFNALGDSLRDLLDPLSAERTRIRFGIRHARRRARRAARNITHKEPEST